MKRLRESDLGVSMVLIAMTLTLLIGAGALAIDIGAIWLDRSADQKITDSAAAAGALETASTGGAEACRSAFAYVAVNSDDISSLNDTQCATVFAAACNAAVPRSLSVNSGRYQVTFSYPVLDGDDLMTSGIVGAGTQALDPGDGSPCERVGVEMTATRNSIFAQLMGFEQGRTTVHTVAITAPAENDPPINLLVLDRTGCRTLATEGGGGVQVDAVIAVDDDGNPIGLTHGIAAADSDGSAGCTTDGVIDLSGSGPYSIRADGPECPGQLGTHGVGTYTAGEGCGRVQTFAPGTPGCAPAVNLPACSPGGGGANVPAPEPTALLRRLTRAPVDYRYNCWGDYTAPPIGINWAVLPLTGGQAIDGCTESDPDHIYDLIQTVGQNGSVAGFTNWTSLGHSCNLGSSDPSIAITDNIRIDCAAFTVRNVVEIRGDVVFDGDVNVTSSGNFTVRSSIGSPGFAFFRDGVLVKDGGASLTFEYTAVYMSRTSQVRMSGGNGRLVWIAPDSGDFDDLALWSDSPLTQFWAGQTNLTMEGVFFTPLATADYSGTSGSNNTNAQWIAYRLLARGGGTLVVRPSVGRGVEFAGVGTQLIR